jgi:hypothetical protein
LEKFKLAYSRARAGSDFLTEATFKNRVGRADFVDLESGIIYEILKTEELESIEEKRKKYPLPIEIIKVE